MPRLNFVKAAAKDHPDHGIKKGESYYWWKFRRGGKHVSKTKPARSALTQSPFYGPLWDLEDRLAALSEDSSWDDLRAERDNIVEELNNLADEQDEKKSNMPDSLQESSTGELLEARAEGLREMAQELEQIDLEGGDEDSKTDAVSDLQGVQYQGE